MGPGETYFSSRQASNMRRQIRRLEEEVGNGSDIKFQFERCQPGDFIAVAELNKRKVEQTGHHHRLSHDMRDRMDRLAVEIGYRSFLFVRGRLIGGTIIFIVGDKAYFEVIGYDLAYAKFSPGLQVCNAATKPLEEMGCRELNFLWGDSRFKSDHALLDHVLGKPDLPGIENFEARA